MDFRKLFSINSNPSQNTPKEIMIEHEEKELHPPCFHVVIRKKAKTTEDLNFKINVIDSIPIIHFHVVASAGILITT